MNRVKLVSFVLIIFFSFSIFSNELEIIEKINKVLPEGMTVQNIKESQVEGIYVVDIGDLQPLYVSKDGSFFFYGELYAVEESSLQNTTKSEINLKRKSILDQVLSQKDFITFRASNEQHVVTVFTDVDCGYCRKFHSEIDDFNNQGITINYVAFPRSGLDSESYNKIVGAWCSNDPHQAITDLKNGLDPELLLCQDHPVEKHYMLGQKIGITGTPAIIASSGELLPGYLPPLELLNRLN